MTKLKIKIDVRRNFVRIISLNVPKVLLLLDKYCHSLYTYDIAHRLLFYCLILY